MGGREFQIEIGLSDGLLGYLTRQNFNYEIEFKFEDEKAAFTDYLYRFLTGEFWHRDNKPMPSLLPRVREIQAGWKVGTTIYNGKFYFDEDEIIKGYTEAFKLRELRESWSLRLANITIGLLFICW